MKPNRKQRRQANRQAARSLLQAITSGEAEVYSAYRNLYGLWCRHNASVQELRPLFRIPGVEPDGRLSVTKEFEAQVRAFAAAILPTLENAISVLHHNDIVEEIATLRQGEIDTIDQYISEGQKMSPHRWRVRFSDGREPLFQYFVRQEDLRLIKCPHTRS
jgi:hypothetical protein